MNKYDKLEEFLRKYENAKKLLHSIKIKNSIKGFVLTPEERDFWSGYQKALEEERARMKHSRFNNREILWFDTFVRGVSNLKSIGGYGAGGKIWYGTPKKEDFDPSHLDFTHGSVEDFYAGKVCVVRDYILYLVNTGEIEDGEQVWAEEDGTDCKVVHLNDKEKVFILGYAPSSGNMKIRYKKFD
jgi:hypothetical protein